MLVHILSCELLRAAFWNFTHAGQSNCCRIRQLTGVCVFSVCETDASSVHQSPVALGCFLSIHRQEAQVSFRASPDGLVLHTDGGSLQRGCHVLSFKMTVARMRKKVFQPRVTAKPRHTIIRDRPQPVGKIYPYIHFYLDTGGQRWTCCGSGVSSVRWLLVVVKC